MNNHSYIRWHSQYVYLNEKIQLRYLSYTACLKTFEYKHMQRKQKTIQRGIQRLYTIDVYRCILIWFIHMYCLRIKQMYRRMYMSMVRVWWCVCRLLG